MPFDLPNFDVLLGLLRAWGPYALGAFAFALVARKALTSRRRTARRMRPGRPGRWRNRAGRPFDAGYGRGSGPTEASAEPDLGDPNVQIGYVLQAQFRHRRLMNAPEFAVFTQTRELLSELGQRHHVFPQVPLAAFLHIDGDYAFRAAGSKRLDLLVVDAGGRPAAAIEYHGSGHFQGDAMQRDRIKKVVLDRAGVPLIELYRDFDRAGLRQEICRALGLSDPAAAPGTPADAQAPEPPQDEGSRAATA
jgi:hypothetical protein